MSWLNKNYNTKKVLEARNTHELGAMEQCTLMRAKKQP